MTRADSTRGPRKVNSPELVIVMPAYNEEASIRKVVLEWIEEVTNWTSSFVLLAIDDGSSDKTLAVLEGLMEKAGARLMVHSRQNKGHGQTCLEGYRMAAALGARYIFQIDSDGQCDPQYFFRFWRMRDEQDVVYGVRTRRDDGFARLCVSMILRLFVLVMFRTFCPDCNVPYRLMRTQKVMVSVNRIPSTFYLANAGLAVLLARRRDCRHAYVPIRFRERYGGEPTINSMVFARKAIEFYRDFRGIRGRTPELPN